MQYENAKNAKKKCKVMRTNATCKNTKAKQ